MDFDPGKFEQAVEVSFSEQLSREERAAADSFIKSFTTDSEVCLMIGIGWCWPRFFFPLPLSLSDEKGWRLPLFHFLADVYGMW